MKPNLDLDDSKWEQWRQAEILVLRLLDLSRLPAAEQEIASAKVMTALLREWGQGCDVKNAQAWVRVVLAREIGRVRAKGFARTLDNECEVAAPPYSDPVTIPAVSDLREILLGQEAILLARLSPIEQAVLLAVREGRPLCEAAAMLMMSGRDVRTRFRRLCAKLHGILGHLVPPPPHVGEFHKVAVRQTEQGGLGTHITLWRSRHGS